MKKEIADLQTKFSVTGVEAVKTQMQSVAAAAKGVGKAASDAAKSTAQAQSHVALATARAAAEVAKAQALTVRASVSAATAGSAKNPAAAKIAAARAQADLAKARVAMQSARLQVSGLDPKAAGTLAVRQSLGAAGAEFSRVEIAASAKSIAEVRKRTVEAGSAMKAFREAAAAAGRVSLSRLQASLHAVTVAAQLAARSVRAIGGHALGLLGSVGSLAGGVAKAGGSFVAWIGGTAVNAVKSLATHLASAVSYLVRLGMRTVIRLAVAYKGFQGAAVGYGVKATNEAANYTRDIRDQSATTGMSVSQYSGMVGMGRSAGLDQSVIAESMGQSWQQIYGALQDPNSPMAQMLTSLRVRLVDFNGTLRGTGQIIDDILRATQGNELARLTVFMQLFGQNGVKMARMYEQMQNAKFSAPFMPVSTTDKHGNIVPNGMSDYQELYGEQISSKALQGMTAEDIAALRQKHYGSLVTEQDVALSNQFKSAVADLKESLIGLQMTIMRRIGPGLSILARWFGELIAKNRFAAAEYIAQTLVKLVKLGDDFVQVFFGKNRKPTNGNNWLVWLHDGLSILATGFVRTMQFASEFWLQVQGRGSEGQWPWVGTLVANLRLLGHAMKYVGGRAMIFGQEVGYAMKGENWKVRQFPFILSIARGFKYAKALVHDFMHDVKASLYGDYQTGRFPWLDDLVQKLVFMKNWVSGLWKDVWNMSDGFAPQTDQGKALQDYIQKAGEWISWFKDQIMLAWATATQFYNDLKHGWEDVNAILNGGNAVYFTSLNDGFKKFVENLKQAVKWAKGLYAAMDSVVTGVSKFFGADTNLQQAGLLLLLVRLTGGFGILSLAAGAAMLPLKAIIGLMRGAAKLIVFTRVAQGAGLAAAFLGIGQTAAAAAPGVAGLTSGMTAAGAAAGGLATKVGGLLPLLTALAPFGIVAAGVAAGWGLSKLAEGTAVESAASGFTAWYLDTDAKVAAAAAFAKQYNDTHRTGKGDALSSRITSEIDWSKFNGDQIPLNFLPQSNNAAAYPAPPPIPTTPEQQSQFDAMAPNRVVQVRQNGDPDKIINIYTNDKGLADTTEGMQRSFTRNVWERG